MFRAILLVKSGDGQELREIQGRPEYFNMDHADNGTWWAVPSAYDNKKNRKKYEENICIRIDWMWLGGSI